MVTTFCSLGSRHAKNTWQFLEKANQANISLTELEHSKKDVILFREGPCLRSPYLYTALKLKYSLDVEGVSRDG